MSRIDTRTWFRILGSIVFLLLAGLAVFVVYFLLREGLSLLRSLEKEVAAAIVAASATIIVAVLTVSLTSRANKARELADAHRPAKIQVYDGFLRFLFGLFKATKRLDPSAPPGNLDESQLDQFMEQKRILMLWGSPSVVQKMITLEESTSTGSERLMLRLDEMIREMRNDLGVSNRGLRKGAIVEVFLDSDSRNRLRSLVAGKVG
ncbi:MAG: hypothetical protein QUU85_08435 [Candidatus Eisenbacteria bacterium]|nr:hypothetical protein [Candidatus Eisenbacteria bacterium]